jgi:hypothetical protein
MSQPPNMANNSFRTSPVSAPPLMNPPPQIFGAYTPEGVPIPATLPDVGAPMFTDGSLMEESNEAKRRRIARVRYLAPRGAGI